MCMHYLACKQTKTLLGEALLHIVWVKNRSATWVLDRKTQYEMLYRKKPHLGDLLVWDLKCRVLDHSGWKLDDHTTEGTGSDMIQSWWHTKSTCWIAALLLLSATLHFGVAIKLLQLILRMLRTTMIIAHHPPNLPIMHLIPHPIQLQLPHPHLKNDPSTTLVIILRI